MYYFAYGSNMNLEHMRRLCGWHFSVLGPAALADFELGADLRGFATVRQQSGKQVMGVLYEIDDEALKAMDEFEGYPEVFNRIEVEVEDENGDRAKAYMYLEPADQFGSGHMRENYIKRMVTGARENHLPDSWIDFLLSFQA